MGGECLGVYFVRLQRDGWGLQPSVSDSEVTVFEKMLSHGWMLRKYAHAQVGAPPGKGCYWDEHELEQAETGCRIDGATWEWAERDGNGLVRAEAGCLFRSTITPRGLGEGKLLYDFNSLKFTPLAAPY